jgi:hypothetical protein
MAKTRVAMFLEQAPRMVSFFARETSVAFIDGCCRVEEGRGSLGHSATPRLPSPLIKPDLRISRIRLSDRLHYRPTVAARGGMRVRRCTPRSPKIAFMEKLRVPRPPTLCRLARKRLTRTETWRSTAR